MTEKPAPDQRTAPEEVDERAIARKYGLRELIYPGSEQVNVLGQFLSNAVKNGRMALVPKTAVVVMLEFVQGTLNRQNITKGPRMSHEEFDILQAPYYLAARIVSKIVREKQQQAVERGKLYQTTHLTLNQFVELLRNLIDPGCHWLRMKALPDGIREVMDVMYEFTQAYPEQRRKGRAM